MVILTGKLVGKARLVGGPEGLLCTACSPCLHLCHLGALFLGGTHIGHSENGVWIPCTQVEESFEVIFGKNANQYLDARG